MTAATTTSKAAIASAAQVIIERQATPELMAKLKSYEKEIAAQGARVDKAVEALTRSKNEADARSTALAAGSAAAMVVGVAVYKIKAS
ncbi:MAG TPA: hypothetical protein VGM34_01855 [Chlamydiales bacterium]|jgi:hypothetical protein